VDELKMLAVAEIERHIGGAIRAQRDGGVDSWQGIDWRQRGWRRPENDDAGVVLR
jgi:hypothetical protein